MKRLLLCIVTLGMVLPVILTGAVQAVANPVENPSFEDNVFGSNGFGWDRIGLTGLVGADVVSPTDGSQQALLATSFTFTGMPTFQSSSIDAVLDFIGVAEINVGGVVNAVQGTATKQTVDLKAGDSLSFDYAFDTDEPSMGGNNDKGFFFFDDMFVELAAADGAGMPAYASFSIDIDADDSYCFGFVVVDVDATEGRSELFIDNIKVAGAGAIPVSASAWIFCAGLLGVLAIGSRHR